MTNRAERRRQMRTNAEGTHSFYSTGLNQEVMSKHHNQDFPVPEPGKHLWVVSGAWKINDPEQSKHHLDMENLLTIEGPGCLWCEKQYSKELAAQLCEGDVSS